MEDNTTITVKYCVQSDPGPHESVFPNIRAHGLRAIWIIGTTNKRTIDYRCPVFTSGPAVLAFETRRYNITATIRLRSAAINVAIGREGRKGERAREHLSTYHIACLACFTLTRVSPTNLTLTNLTRMCLLLYVVSRQPRSLAPLPHNAGNFRLDFARTAATFN